MKRIIVVEDDESIQDVFQLAFRENEYDLIMLDSGEKIISTEIEAPDLFILDKQITGASGLDVCRFIKRTLKFKDVPVIMFSASPDIIKTARDAGADDVIAKPFSLKKLRETISKFVNKN